MQPNGSSWLIPNQNKTSKMTLYYSNYLNHLAVVKDNFPARPGEAQTIYRKLTVNLLDKYFFKIIKQLGVNEFYECGAHDASASIKFSKIGKAIAIEANPYTYKEKTIKAQKFGVKTYNFVLGLKKSKAKLLIPSQNLGSGSTSVLAKVKSEKIDYLTIDSTTIDIICAQNLSKNSSVAFWVDVEGFAYEVLKGGHKTLTQKNVKVIKVELEEKPIWGNQKLSSDVYDLLLSYDFLPVFFDFERVGQHNCIYVRSEHISDIENLISAYFRELSNLKLRMFDYIFYTCRDFLHAKKNNKSNSLSFHFIYFLLGSKSSKNILRSAIRLRK
jgi:FkbM family methyltransferase